MSFCLNDLNPAARHMRGQCFAAGPATAIAST